MLASWKKSYDKPESVLKSRDNALPANVCLDKAMVFPVVMYGCESWTILKRLSAEELLLFKLWYWRRLLRVPWTTRTSNQSILKEINSEYSLEGLMLKLKLQHFGHLMRRADWKRSWCWERLKTEGERDNRGQDGWMALPTQWACIWASSGKW